MKSSPKAPETDHDDDLKTRGHFLSGVDGTQLLNIDKIALTMDDMDGPSPMYVRTYNAIHRTKKNGIEPDRLAWEYRQCTVNVQRATN